ncbi:hypothetical protein C8R45DRAFT_1162755 [Mycena sanguinolenta]|nr:hypothetical protein C8R45DRAFT_1162755 [Mycena sanguinolenta]
MSILVDDNDPLVQYSPPGGWSQAGELPEFDATTHTSVTWGSTATLVFEGTSISVYGTLQPSSGQAGLNFSIDGMNVASYQAPLVPAILHNQLFWTSPTFPEAEHELVITVDRNTTQPNTIFFLDYFIYTTTSITGKTLLMDDADASVTYSPDGWKSSNSCDNCLQSTQHISTSAGSWAAVSFNGTGISVIGTPPQTGFKVSIVIDGNQPVISQSQTQNQLFNTGDLLPSGPHTINMTVLESDLLSIDYFLVTDAGSSTTKSQSAPTAPTTQLSGSSKKSPVAAIVGGATGSLIVLMLLLTLIIWQHRRRARRNNTQIGFSVFPRWVGSDVDDLSIIVPRPFPTTDPPPPQYTSKRLPVVRQ